ncbi:hypothetical protein H696_01961 [Fonticula alba]|uniref:Vacuolar protein sorting-associated protein 52 homolog n=1 Tax=Fonticula alba TaxID=691883 RepID=A0A058Z9W6_FONAL|nr:hypothetical protein H696_01961 [Fonticula alba]KCV71015.1 hypothetical protein H696_01961 [Fonticula alba]|eukprot:XP_009494138.1 hypothetical protein H696_01961 [Fonticula alba]
MLGLAKMRGPRGPTATPTASPANTAAAGAAGAQDNDAIMSSILGDLDRVNSMREQAALSPDIAAMENLPAIDFDLFDRQLEALLTSPDVPPALRAALAPGSSGTEGSLSGANLHNHGRELARQLATLEGDSVKATISQRSDLEALSREIDQCDEILQRLGETLQSHRAALDERSGEMRELQARARAHAARARNRKAAAEGLGAFRRRVDLPATLSAAILKAEPSSEAFATALGQLSERLRDVRTLARGDSSASALLSASSAHAATTPSARVLFSRSAGGPSAGGSGLTATAGYVLGAAAQVVAGAASTVASGAVSVASGAASVATGAVSVATLGAVGGGSTAASGGSAGGSTAAGHPAEPATPRRPGMGAHGSVPPSPAPSAPTSPTSARGGPGQAPQTPLANPPAAVVDASAEGQPLTGLAYPSMPPALASVLPELERLRLAACARSYEHLLERIHSITKPTGAGGAGGAGGSGASRSNAAMQQQALSTSAHLKKLWRFLESEAPERESRELRDAYINQMREYYSRHFGRYVSSTQKLWHCFVSEADLIAIDDPELSAAFAASTRSRGLLSSISSLATLSLVGGGSSGSSASGLLSGSGSSATAETVNDYFTKAARLFGLGERDDAALGSFIHGSLSGDGGDIIVPHTMDKAQLHFETIFRSQLLALADNASGEYLFLWEFFGARGDTAAALFQRVYEPALVAVASNLRTHLPSEFDALCLLLCVRIASAVRNIMRTRRVPILDSFLHEVVMLLWPRFQKLMDSHCTSVRTCVDQLESVLANPAATAKSAAAARPDAVYETLARCMIPVAARFGNLYRSLLTLSSPTHDFVGSPGSLASPNSGLGGPGTPGPAGRVSTSSHMSMSRSPSVASLSGAAGFGPGALTSASVASELAPVAQSLQRLRTEVESAFFRSASLLVDDRRRYTVYLLRCYDSVVRAFDSSTLQALEEERNYWMQMRAPQMSHLVYEEIAIHLPQLVSVGRSLLRAKNRDQTQPTGRRATDPTSDASLETVAKEFHNNWRKVLSQVRTDLPLLFPGNDFLASEVAQSILREFLVLYSGFLQFVEERYGRNSRPPFSVQPPPFETVKFETRNAWPSNSM